MLSIQKLRFFLKIISKIPPRNKVEILRKESIAHFPLVKYMHDSLMAKTIKNGVTKPLFLIIENTNICNAQCVICSHKDMKREKGVMSTDLYKRIIDEMELLNISQLQLAEMGEPLLDPNLTERVKYASKKSIRVRIFTNGSLVSSTLAKNLIDSGLSEITFSIDDVVQEDYERIRYPLKYHAVIENLKRLFLLRVRLHKKTPIISIAINSIDKTAAKLRQYREYRFIKEHSDFIKICSREMIHDWSEEYIDNKEIKRYAQEARRLPCRRLWTDMTVFWDGRVPLCCIDYEGKNILGDTNKQSISEIWRGKLLAQTRDVHLRGEYKSIPLCNNCLLRYDWWVF